MNTSRAAVLVEPERFEIVDLELPQIADGDGLLRVEGCGLCGTDIGQFRKTFDADLPPAILGHEVVGTIEHVGMAAARRWGVRKGDRVAVEPILQGCGRCAACRDGRPIGCVDNEIPNVPVYSRIPVTYASGLWGGFAEYMYLHPRAVLHPISSEVPIREAVLFNPLANGVQWSVLTPNPAPGASVLVLGPGQRGLASVVALRAFTGVGEILVTGLSRDEHRLRACQEAGATQTVDVETQSLAAVVEAATGGQGVDLIIDTTDGAPSVVGDAISASKLGGTIVLAGHKNGQPSEVFVDSVIKKNLTILGAQSASWDAFHLAVELVQRRVPALRLFPTHVYGLSDLSDALSVLSGATASEKPPISIAVVPGVADHAVS